MSTLNIRSKVGTSTLTLKSDGRMRLHGGGQRGTRKVAIDDIADVHMDGDETRRITVTRVVTLGVFALGAKKRTGGIWLTVIGRDGWSWTAELHPSSVKDARLFMARVEANQQRAL